MGVLVPEIMMQSRHTLSLKGTLWSAVIIGEPLGVRRCSGHRSKEGGRSRKGVSEWTLVGPAELADASTVL